MNNIYSLIQAIECTSGAQQESWKGQLHELVMQDVYRCIDAEAEGLRFEEKIERREAISATIHLLLNLAPEGGKEWDE